MEQRFDRMEDMLTQLITMVGHTNRDLQIVKTDVAELKTDVAVLKTDVAELKTEVADQKIGLGVLTGRFDHFEKGIYNYYETQNYLLKKSQEHDRDIEVIKQRLAR